MLNLQALLIISSLPLMCFKPLKLSVRELKENVCKENQGATALPFPVLMSGAGGCNAQSWRRITHGLHFLGDLNHLGR